MRADPSRPLRALLCGGLAVFIAGASAAVAEMRVWRDKSGREVQGTYIRQIFGAVALKTPAGTSVSIPLAVLSDADLSYIHTVIFTKVEITARKKTKAKERNKDFVKDGDYINVVTLDVQIEKKSREPFNRTLSAEVYLIGKEVYTGDFVLTGKGASAVKFTEENGGVSPFSTAADFRVYEEYNGLQTRGAEYEGYLVLVFDPNGGLLDYKTDLSWLREQKKIDALRKFYVGSFFDENCRKRSVPRPLYYSARVNF